MPLENLPPQSHEYKDTLKNHDKTNEERNEKVNVNESEKLKEREKQEEKIDRINQIKKDEKAEKNADNVARNPDKWLEEQLASEYLENELGNLSDVDLVLNAQEPNPDEGEKGGLVIDGKYVPKNNEIIKRIQRFLNDEGYSIMDGNKKSSKQSIDGVIGNDTYAAIQDYKKDYRERKNGILGIFNTFNDELEKTGEKDISQQEKRDVKIGVKGNIGDINIDFSSYNSIATIKGNKLSISGKEFPIELKFNTNNGKVSFDNDQSNINMLHGAFKLANFINWFNMFCDEKANKFDLSLRGGSIINNKSIGDRMRFGTTIIDDNALEEIARILGYNEKSEIKDFSKKLLDHLNSIVAYKKDQSNRTHRSNKETPQL